MKTTDEQMNEIMRRSESLKAKKSMNDYIIGFSIAIAACSALILRCLGEGLYPSWDAANMASVCLAEKLGYELDHPYTAYAVSAHKRTH